MEIDLDSKARELLAILYLIYCLHRVKMYHRAYAKNRLYRIGYERITLNRLRMLHNV